MKKTNPDGSVEETAEGTPEEIRELERQRGEQHQRQDEAQGGRRILTDEVIRLLHELVEVVRARPVPIVINPPVTTPSSPYWPPMWPGAPTIEPWWKPGDLAPGFGTLGPHGGFCACGQCSPGVYLQANQDYDFTGDQLGLRD